MSKVSLNQNTCSLLANWGKLPLAFGGASLSGEGGGYGFGAIVQKSIQGMLEYCLEKGMTIFDTAPIYGFGESELRLGRALKSRREKVRLISKSGVHWHDNKRVDMSNDPKIAEKMLHESLKRLDTDYIDLYMIHWPDERVDIRKTLEVLVRAQEQKKILHLGLCNTTLDDLTCAREVATIEVVQSQCNLFEGQSAPLMQKLRDEKISFMGWGTLDKGIIPMTVTKERKFDETDARSWAPWWKKSNKDQKMQFMQMLAPYLKEQGVSGLELALGASLRRGCDVALVGGKSIQQWEDTFAALERLPELSLVEEVVNRWQDFIGQQREHQKDSTRS
jgi:myo-inositol catabolism protein IolS